jgi:hypothetical protein
MLQRKTVKKLHLSLKSVPEGTILSAAKIIHSLPCMDGDPRKIYAPEIISWRQPRQRSYCGKTFTPRHASQKWQRFCGKSCSAYWRMAQTDIRKIVFTKERNQKISARGKEFMVSGKPEAMKRLARIASLNPMKNKEGVRKMIETKTRNGTLRIAPKQGGNGRDLPLPVLFLLHGLGRGWRHEFAVSLGKKKPGYPTAYKVDIAHPARMIAIEVDGQSHCGKRRLLDKKKDTMMALLGWKVLRFSNGEILNWINTGMPKDASIVMTLKRHGINLSL